MESNTSQNPSLVVEIGPDGLAREAPVIAYTEKIIEEEQLQLRKYIEENYSKIRDVERELSSLTMEMKLTAGPKKAALEHLRKKIEMATERIRLAKHREDQARKVLEEATKAVKEEEEMKKKLCDDLNQLVQESSNFQFSRLEELKRRLEALNPSRASSAAITHDVKSTGPTQAITTPEASPVTNVPKEENGTSVPATNGFNPQASVAGDGRAKNKTPFQGRGKGIGAVPKGRAPPGPGWTGAGFDS